MKLKKSTFKGVLMILPFTKSSLVFSMLTCINAIYALPTNCPNFYAGGQTPDINDARLVPKITQLCYYSFGVMYSGLTKHHCDNVQYKIFDDLE